MHVRRSTTVACWVCTTLALLAALAAASAEDISTPDGNPPALDAAHGLFAATLARIVTPAGVDYGSLRDDHGDLDRYRTQLAHAVVSDDPTAKKALFIDAYNAWTLALVSRSLPSDRSKWPTWSIKDAGSLTSSVWKRYTFELGGRRYTLDQVEHDILRPLGDPRIHTAINCASRGCPPLQREPYTAEHLDAQLDAAAAAFAASDYHVRLDAKGIRVNPILDWFAKDFDGVGGARGFLVAHLVDGPKKQAVANAAKIAFFDYDWTLNLAP